jgi:hypothetical protein
MKQIAVEKAKELYYSMSYWHMVDGGTNVYEAKQCALIAVEEIIEMISGIDPHWMNELMGYWEEVKQEIQNI